VSADPFDAAGTQGAVIGTVGAPTGFLDNFRATLNVAANNDRWLDGEREIQDGWQNSLRAYQQRTGQQLPDSNPIKLIEDSIDPERDRPFARWFSGADDTSPHRVAQFQAAQDINEQIKALNDPNIKSIEQIIEAVKDARGLRAQDAQDVSEASTPIGGLLGRLAGGVVGSMTDPAQLPTLIAGGFGKTVAMRIGTEVATNAAAGGFIQGELINPQNKLFGEQEGSVGEAALLSGLAGGVLRGAGEGLGALATRALDRVSLPQVDSFNFDDPQLRQMFERAPDSPATRAGIAALDENAHFEANNPYAHTGAGLQRFTGEAEDITRAFSGDTAVGRFLAPVEDFTLDNLDYHTQVVREQAPEIFDRLEQATARVNQLDEEIAGTQDTLANISVSDVLRKIDEDSANLVQSYEQELANPNLSKADRAALQQKIDGIKESVGAVQPELADQIAAAEQRLAEATTKGEQLAAARDLDKLHKAAGEDILQKAVDSVEIPLKKKTQALRASRKAAAREFKAARDEMDRAIEKIKAEERVKELLHPQQGTDPAGAFDVEMVRGDRAAQAQKLVDDWWDSLQRGDFNEDLVREKPPVEEGAEPVTTVPEGMVDIGNGTLLPRDFVVSNPDGGETTVGALFDEMKDDVKLVDAMKVCAI